MAGTTTSSVRSSARGDLDLTDLLKQHNKLIDDLAAIDAGLVAPIAPTSEIAVLLWSMVHGIVSLRIAHPDMPWPDEERQVDTLFNSLAIGLCTPEARTQMGKH